MRSMILIAALASTLVVAGCAKGPSGTSPVPPAPGPGPVVIPAPDTPAGQKAAEIIGRVQEETRKICKFVPTAQTVANLLARFGVGTLGGLLEVAQQVCAVVGPPSSSAGRYAGRKTLRGIVIRGHYVR